MKGASDATRAAEETLRTWWCGRVAMGGVEAHGTRVAARGGGQLAKLELPKPSGDTIYSISNCKSF